MSPARHTTVGDFPTGTRPHPTDVSHRGGNIGTALHRGRLAFGATFGAYEYRDAYAGEDGVVDAHTNRVVNPFVSWMFAPNARLGFDLRYVDDGQTGEDWPHFRLRYDIGF